MCQLYCVFSMRLTEGAVVCAGNVVIAATCTAVEPLYFVVSFQYIKARPSSNLKFS
jgi:hypothetical protein